MLPFPLIFHFKAFSTVPAG